MNKYFQILKISLAQEFTYKINFVVWRLRNVLQIIIAFFLWDTIFQNGQNFHFGYSKSKIITYVFTLILVRSFVFSAKATDVSKDISEGDLSNFLIKPVSYFKYWFTRDLSSKIINLAFAILEFAFLFLILKPDFYWQSNVYVFIAFLISIAIAIFIYFTILFLISSVCFWAPEYGWASQFLILVVIVEFLSGAVFPIDILPNMFQKLIMATPFPYTIFFPIQVYLGKITGGQLVVGFLISLAWCFVLWFLMKVVWNRGLKVYQAFGR